MQSAPRLSYRSRYHSPKIQRQGLKRIHPSFKIEALFEMSQDYR